MFLMLVVFALLGGFLEPGPQQVSGIMIYTAQEVEAVKGMDVKLKCIFQSRYPVSLESVYVNWSFKRLHGRREKSVLFYYKKPYPPSEGRFRKRVAWSGDVMNKDASITLKRVNLKFNGTFTCGVKNVPDTHGRDGEVRLRVVNNATNLNPFDFFSKIFA